MNETDREDEAPSWFNQTPGTIYKGIETRYNYAGGVYKNLYSGVACKRCDDARVEIHGTPPELVEQIILRRWRNLADGWTCPKCVAEMKQDGDSVRAEEFVCEICEAWAGRSDARDCPHLAGARWRAHQEEATAGLPAWYWQDKSGKSIRLRVVGSDDGRAIEVACSAGLTMTGRVAQIMSAWIIKQMEGESSTRPDHENDLLVAVIRSAVSDRWHIYAKEGKVHARYTGDGVHNVYPDFVMGNEPIGDFVTRLNQYRP